MTAAAVAGRTVLVERLAPETKILTLLGFVSAVVCTPREQMWAFAVFGIVVLAVATVVGITPRHLARRLLIEVPFLVFAVALPIVGTGPRVDVLGVSLSEAGLWAAWSILAKGTIGVAASVVLATSTTPADLIVGLERLRVPRTLTAIAGFMVRYLDVVSDELRRLQIARISRGDDPRFLFQAKATAATLGTLFVRSYERGERVHTAMQSRGFDGTLPAAPSRVTAGADVGPIVGNAAPVAIVAVAWAVAFLALSGVVT